MTNTFVRFSRIRNAGVFKNFRHTSELSKLRKYNLIYGFNGSGKTTLSRILRSIELGKISEALSEETEFSFEMADGYPITNTTIEGKPNKSLAVFNTDFVEENLR